MALSGSFTGSTNNQFVKPKITWSAKQNQNENYSTVTATLTYSRTNSGYTTSGKWEGSITINGETTSVSTTEQIYITQNSNTKAMSATVKVPHNDDGSKSITISCTGAIKAAGLTTTTCSSVVVLDTIIRKATITTANDVKDTDNPSISFKNPGDFRMDAWFEIEGERFCVDEDIENTGIHTWEITDEEREALRNKCKGADCPLRIVLASYVRGKQETDYKDKRFVMTENDATKPVVTAETVLNNGSLPGKFDGMYIQGKSRLGLNISAEGKYGATIDKYGVVVGTEAYTSDVGEILTGVIKQSGETDVVAYALDSRKFKGTVEQKINVHPHSKPLILPLGGENAIQCYRSNENGDKKANSASVWVKAKMTYSSVSDLNNCALQWRRKLVEDEWNDLEHKWHDLIPKTNQRHEFNGLIPNDGETYDNLFDLRTAYSVQIRAIDDIGEYDIKNFEIPTQDVALDLGEGGKNVTVGDYCDYSEEHTFRSAWDAIFEKGVFIGEKENRKELVYLVDHGTVNGWKYEKWSNGTAKCSASIKVEVATGETAEWGDMFVASCASVNDKLTFPFEFLEVPTCNYSLTGDPSSSDFSANFWIATVNEGIKLSTTTAQQVQLIRPTAAVRPQRLILHYQVEGKWK